MRGAYVNQLAVAIFLAAAPGPGQVALLGRLRRSSLDRAAFRALSMPS
jgi:hypothetical protein